MQLRKRKRVDYSGHIKQEPQDDAILNFLGITYEEPKEPEPEKELKRKNIPLTNSTRKSRARKILKNVIIQGESISPSMKFVSLKRPSYESLSDYNNEDDSVLPITSLQEFLRTLDRLIPIQDKLYYKNLTGPKFLGPKNFESLRLPSDIQNLQNIGTNLKQLIELKIESENSQAHNALSTSYTPTIKTYNEKQIRSLNNLKHFSDNDMVNKVAWIHNINTLDIKELKHISNKNMLDSSFVNIGEVKAISRKLDKRLIRERDMLLEWPTKTKRKKKRTNPEAQNKNDSDHKFANVPLFNSV